MSAAPESTDSGINQYFDLGEFDRTRPIEFSFWSKFSEQNIARAIMEDDGWNKFKQLTYEYN